MAVARRRETSAFLKPNVTLNVLAQTTTHTRARARASLLNVILTWRNAVANRGRLGWDVYAGNTPEWLSLVKEVCVFLCAKNLTRT